MSSNLVPERAAPVISMAVGAALAGVRTAIPAVVLSYDEVARKVSCRPVVADIDTDELGARIAEASQVATNVPVIFPGGRGAHIRWTIRPGDFVLLIACHADIDRWLSAGGENIEPATDRRHDISDAVAIPGLCPFTRTDDEDATIEFTSDGKINAGGGASLALQDLLSSLIGLYNAHTHTLSGAGIPNPPFIASDTGGTSILRGG